MTDRTAILVLGMHRSGTSALTRVLGHLGCAMPRDGIGAHPDNPKGYWEPQALVRESDRVFRTARTSWFDPRPLNLATIPEGARTDHVQSFARALSDSFAGAPLIAVKDPRLSRLVPLLVEAAASLGYATRVVLMTRSAGAIARSLHARDLSTPSYATALWLRYMLDAERDSRDLPRALVDYDALLDDWRAALKPVMALLHPEGFAPDDEAEAAIDRHLDGTLRHHRDAEPLALDPRLAQIADQAEAALSALTERDDAAARARMDAVAAAFAAPRLLDDIIHDELRHRRVRELQPAREPAGPVPAEEEKQAVEPEEEEAELQVEDVTAPESAPVEPAPVPEIRADPGVRDIDAEVVLVRQTGLFDEDWYRGRYPDVAASGEDPVRHYLTIGAREGRDPHPLFQTVYYARQMARRALMAEGKA